MRVLGWGLLAVTLTLWEPKLARAEIADDCVQSADLDLKIRACTAAIQSGNWSGKNLAWAYTSRGNAYRRRGEYKRSIQEFESALRLDPGFASAYHARGTVYERLGRFDAALSDWETAIDLEGAARVRRWQEWTRDRGHYRGAIDGIYGPGTRAALIACARDPDC